MARNAIDESTYIDAIKKQLNKGGGIDEITATKLQKLIGGQYSRIKTIVEKFKESYKAEKESKEQSPQAPWFKNMVTELSGLVADKVNEQWLVIHEESSETIKMITDDFEKQKASLLSQKNEDETQISILEVEVVKLNDSLEGAGAELERLKNEVARLSILVEESGQSKSDLKEEVKGLQDKNISLISEVANIKGQLSVYKSIEN